MQGGTVLTLYARELLTGRILDPSIRNYFAYGLPLPKITSKREIN